MCYILLLSLHLPRALPHPCLEFLDYWQTVINDCLSHTIPEIRVCSLYNVMSLFATEIFILGILLSATLFILGGSHYFSS